MLCFDIARTLGSCNAFPKSAALLCTKLTLCRAAENDSAVLRCIFLSDSFVTDFVWARSSLVIYLF